MDVLRDVYQLFLHSPTFAASVGGTLFWLGCGYLGWWLWKAQRLKKKRYLLGAWGLATLSLVMLGYFWATGWERAARQLWAPTLPDLELVLGLVSLGTGALCSLLVLPMLAFGMGGAWGLQLTHNPKWAWGLGGALAAASLIGMGLTLGSGQLFAFSLLGAALLFLGAHQVARQSKRAAHLSMKRER